MGAPLVSVVMPARDAAATLARALGSVQAQEIAEWECLVVDDGSRDATPGILARAAAADPRIRPHRLAVPRGAAAARNHAIAAARGRLIAFLDADDEWLPGKLGAQLEFMERQGAAFSFTAYWRERDGRRRRVGAPARVTHARLLRGNVVGCLTAIYDAGALGRVYMPDLALRQDYGLWLRLLRLTEEGRGLDEALAVHHVSRGSLSANKWRASAQTWTLYRREERLSRPRAALCLASHLIGRLAR